MSTNPWSDRVLNRKPHYDFRNYRLSDFITPAMRAKAMGTPAREWDLPFIPDQGNTGHCVGFGWLNFGNCDPVMDGWPNDRGHEIYYKAKEYDGEPGNENGSSTLSGVKAFMDFGKLKDSAYAFATSLEDVKIWTLANGPVVTGSDWYDGMFYPDSNGVVVPSGWVAGGHEYMIIGYERETDLFHYANSWGTGFGIDGKFYMHAVDYEKLMRQQGDACTAFEITSTPVPPPPPPPEPPPAPGCAPISSIFYSLYKWTGGR